jgi:hypothetical protein
MVFGALLGHENGNPALAPIASPDTYFNLAHCACSQPLAADPGYVETTFAYEVLAAGELWVGANCDTTTAQCRHVGTVTTTPATPEIKIIDLMEPEPTSNGCDMRAITGHEWVIATSGASSVDIATDALPPPLPTEFSTVLGSDTIDLFWTPSADISDIYGYQLLCATTDGAPGRTGTPPPAEYITARQLCGEPLDVPLVPNAIVPGDNTDIPIPQSIAQLDPTLICAESLDPNASSLHVDHLRPGKSYVLLLVVVDRAGNAAATYFHPTVTTETTSGGCCRAAGNEPPLAIVLLLLLRTGTGRRTIRRSASARTTPSAPPPTRTRRAPDPATTRR